MPQIRNPTTGSYENENLLLIITSSVGTLIFIRLSEGILEEKSPKLIRLKGFFWQKIHC